MTIAKTRIVRLASPAAATLRGIRGRSERIIFVTTMPGKSWRKFTKRHIINKPMTMKINCMKSSIVIISAITSLAHCANAVPFGDDVAFLKQHTEIIVLSDQSGKAEVAVSPAWQGRVMTSTAGAADGISFGWINRELIASGIMVPHINVFGGEDRFWLGPEGGQFSIFFAKGAKFELADWFTPAPLDTLPFKVARQSRTEATFTSEFAVTNYSGVRFEVAVKRTVRLLTPAAVWKNLGLPPAKGVSLVACDSKSVLCSLSSD